jgi:hypothetical protein
LRTLYTMCHDPDSLSDDEKYLVYKYSGSILLIILALVPLVTFAMNLPLAQI